MYTDIDRDMDTDTNEIKWLLLNIGSLHYFVLLISEWIMQNGDAVSSPIGIRGP